MHRDAVGYKSRMDLRSAGTGPMPGAFWRYRVGDYRIICDIQDGALRVLVVEVANRRHAPQRP